MVSLSPSLPCLPFPYLFLLLKSFESFKTTDSLSAVPNRTWANLTDGPSLSSLNLGNQGKVFGASDIQAGV